MMKIFSVLAMATLLTACNLFDGSSSKKTVNEQDPSVRDFESLVSDLFTVNDPLASDPVDISQLTIEGTDIDPSFFQGLLDQEN